MGERIHPGGPVRYFHAPETRELWAIPDNPDVSERMESITKRRKHPKRLFWSAHAQIVHIRADNWIRPETHQYHYPHTSYPQQTFDSTYQLEELRGYFNARHRFKPGDEITFDEFQKLKL